MKMKIEAQSRTMIGLPNHCSLSFGKVPAEFAKQMKIKIKKLIYFKILINNKLNLFEFTDLPYNGMTAI